MLLVLTCKIIDFPGKKPGIFNIISFTLKLFLLIFSCYVQRLNVKCFAKEGKKFSWDLWLCESKASKALAPADNAMQWPFIQAQNQEFEHVVSIDHGRLVEIHEGQGCANLHNIFFGCCGIVNCQWGIVSVDHPQLANERARQLIFHDSADCRVILSSLIGAEQEWFVEWSTINESVNLTHQQCNVSFRDEANNWISIRARWD